MTDLERAKTLLAQGGYTVVLCGGDIIHTDTRRGVAPLLALLERGEDVSGFAAADKVVGKGAAFLYLRLGVAAVYAFVMSEPAYDLLTAHGVAVTCDTLVPAIRDRRGDGCCPIEQAVWGVTDSAEAESAIRVRLAQLQARG